MYHVITWFMLMTLLAPSPTALQDLHINCCEDYAKLFDIMYNVRKTCMCIKAKCYKVVHAPTLYLNGQIKLIIGNSLVRNFKHCKLNFNCFKHIALTYMYIVVNYEVCTTMLH